MRFPHASEDETRAFLLALRPTRVLDLGCGVTGSRVDLPGYPRIVDLYRGAEFVGCEVDAAIRVPPAGYRQLLSGARLGEVGAGWFDLVCAFNVLEHVEDLDVTLGEMGRLTARGGFCFVGVPEGRSLGDMLYRLHGRVMAGRSDHLRALTRAEWVEGIKRHGFARVGELENVENFSWVRRAPLRRALAGVAETVRRCTAPTQRLHRAGVHGYFFVFERL